MMPILSPRPRRRAGRALSTFVFVALAFAAGARHAAAADGSGRRAFDIPGGAAAVTLKQFSAQSGEQVLYSADMVEGLGTQAAQGTFTAREALDRMLAGTELRAVQDARTGAFAIRRNTPPPAADAGRGAPPPRRAEPSNAAPRDVASEEPMTLNPFLVSAGEDRGYQAQSSLAGSRLKTNLKDIASPTSAFTQQFFEDTAVTQLDDLAPFMLSTEYDFSEDSGNQNRLTDNSRPLRVRGLTGGSISVNFFKSSYRTDTFNLERVDQSRGPNSVLFGIGDPGGSINVATKRAQPAKPRVAIALQGRSHEGLREEIDVNQPLWRDRVAVRLAAVQDRRNTWRNYEYDDEDRLYVTLRGRLTPRTDLNLDFERADVEKATKRTFTAYDGYTLWRDAGRALNANASPAQGIARVAGNNVPWIVYFTDTGTLMNMRNTTASVARTSSDGDSVTLQDFSVLPKETAIYGPGFYQALNYNRLGAYLTHTFSPDFAVEVAALRTDSHIDNSDPQAAPGQILKVDTQPTLPTGPVNPNAGRAYFESIPQRNLLNTRDDGVRAMLGYRRNLGRWGTHRLAGAYHYSFSKLSQAVIREQIVSTNAPSLVAPENNNNRILRRTYVDLNGPSDRIVMADYRTQHASGLLEPVGNVTYTTAWVPFNSNTQLNSNAGTSLTGILQSSFWRNRLQTILGASRDRRDDYLSTQVRAPLPGFTSGILTPVRSHTPNEVEAHGVSFSAVLHATEWLSLTYSRAQNSGLPSFLGVLNKPEGGLMRPPVPLGRSEDVGLKLDLFQHRLFLTAQFFQTSADRAFDFVSAMSATINPIWNALDAAGVLAANGLEQQIVRDVASGSTFDSRTHGFEVELTANPREHWRVFFNVSRGTTQRTNIGREEQAYIANFRDLWLRHGSLPLVDSSGRTVAQAVAAVDQGAFTNFVLADGKRPLGQMKHKMNFRTAYDVPAGWAKGVSLGGGVRYLGRPVIGFTATGTAPENIVRKTYYGAEQLFVDASLGYRRKLPALFGRPVAWSLQLNVNNVLDNDAFVRLRQSRDGTLITYRFNPPREWIFTSRFSF